MKIFKSKHNIQKVHMVHKKKKHSGKQPGSSHWGEHSNVSTPESSFYAAGPTASLSPRLESRINSLNGGGQPLPQSSRDFFEPRFGKDLSQVRVHTGSNAEGLADSINARAFTSGRNIVLGDGEYSPHSNSGKHLLAHELTHVFQQNNNSDTVNRIQRIPKNPTGVPFDGEITGAWSAALRSKPKKLVSDPHKYTLADLPKGHKVRVLGGTSWIFVHTHIGGIDRAGYVSRELIKKVSGISSPSFETDKGTPISTGIATSTPTLAYEKKWMKDHGLDTKVTRIENSATGNYNCHGFVYLNSLGWLDDPTTIIKDNDYIVPTTPQVGDAVVYVKGTVTLDKKRKPTFSKIPPHSGLVTKGSKSGASEVTSKWGSWHLYKHKPADVWSEYGTPYFLRSSRSNGHTVKIT